MDKGLLGQGYLGKCHGSLRQLSIVGAHGEVDGPSCCPYLLNKPKKTEKYDETEKRKISLTGLTLL